MAYSDINGVTPNDLSQIYASLSGSIRLNEVFDLETQVAITPENEDHLNPEYQLKGMICFLGAHYCCFFRHLESDLEYDPNLTMK